MNLIPEEFRNEKNINELKNYLKELRDPKNYEFN